MANPLVGRTMRRESYRQVGKSAIEIIEEAVHLLRRSPARILAIYYVGTLPFILGLLYFWTDMSRNAFAYGHCAEAALGVSLLFLWMKCWQAAFAGELRAHLCGAPRPRWILLRLVRLAVIQATVQPSSVFALPIAALVMLPFGPTYAFYHNVTSIGTGDSGDARRVLAGSWRRATLWTGQNHILILILLAFWLFVFMNVAVTILLVPALVRILFGVETVFTRSGLHMLNTMLLATAWGVTYLCVNPLVKAVYVLRCFYGESLATGADLKAELRAVSPVAKTAAFASFVVVSLSVWMLQGAAAFSPSSASTILDRTGASWTVSPGELDRAINDVMQQREYAWRMPREKRPRDMTDRSWLGGFMDAVGRTLRRWFGGCARWLWKVAERIAEWLGRRLRAPAVGGSGGGWVVPVRALTVVLVVVTGTAALLVLIKMLRLRGWRRLDVVAEAVSPTPDLSDESLAADELPADTWLTIARELLDKGELRLALRAFYLASLAYLAHHEMIIIAKFKSNREYERELHRRARVAPDLTTAFGENVTIFDRVWYGMHNVTHDILTVFTANFERIKACVERE